MATKTGTNADNTLGGTSSKDVLSGLSGNDTLLGLLGDDTLLGGDGNDFMNGGGGNDRLVGGAGSDTYVVDRAGDAIVEQSGGGIDTVQSSATRTLSANVENLILTGTAAIDGTGNTLANVITGNGAANTLSGLDGNDALLGGNGNDRLLGGNGTDALNGGAGTDRLEGGAGDDSYVVDSLADKVIEGAGAGTDTLRSTIVITNLPANVEVFQLLGNADVNLTGDGDIDRMIGNNGANTISGLGGNDKLAGGGGNDVLLGGAGNDSLDGGTGNDSLVGGDGTDTLQGGAGNDRLVGGAGGDRMSGGGGSDVFVVDDVGDVVLEAVGGFGATTVPGSAPRAGIGEGGASADVDEIRTNNVDIDLAVIAPKGRVEVVRLQGTANINVFGNPNDSSALTIFGNAGNNTLIGQGSDDVIDGGDGDDTMVGGAGNDTYVVDSAGDVPFEQANEGNDTIVVSTNVNLNDFAEFENVTTVGDDDITITGTTGDNVLIGTTGANLIQADAGNDVLEGAAGDDSLDGGTGNDIFTYGFGFGLGDDTIIDPAGTDVLRFLDNDLIMSIAADGNDVLVTRFDGSTIRIVDQFVASTVETIEQRDVEHGIPFTQNLIIGGDDTFGSDVLVGDDGSETFVLHGSAERFDVVYANGGDDVVTAVGLQQIAVFPGTGDDTITSGQGFVDYIAYVTATAITFDFDAGTATIGAETDTFGAIEGFYGGSGNDVFLGTDSLTVFPFFGGGPGDDTLVGGAGFEYIDYFPSLEGVVVDLAAGTGGGGASSGNDTLSDVDDVGGSLFDDTLLGSSGANFIQGYRGDDDLRGRGGNDTYAYNFGDGNDRITDSGGSDDLDYRNFERFDLTWFRDGNDLVQRSIDGQQIRIVGHYAGKPLESVVDFYQIVALVAGSGQGGTSAPDLIVGTSGNDTINGGDGFDRIYGGDGNDVIVVGNDDFAGDWVVPGRGNDTITGTLYSYDEISYLDATGPAEFDMDDGTVTLDGEVDVFVEIEDFYGTPFDDVFNGTSVAGNYVFWEGGPGNDTFNGGDSEEEVGYFFAREGVTVNLSTGIAVGGASVGRDTLNNIDDVFGSAFRDTLIGNSGFNVLTGGSRNLGDSADLIEGRGGDDVLQGRDGDDTLLGGGGNDRLRGDRGEDTMTGGAGDDFFQYGRRFEADEETGVVATNQTAADAGVRGDEISDFTSGADGFHFFQDKFNAQGNVDLGFLSDGVNFSTIAGSYDGTNQGTNSEADAGRDSWIFSTSDLTLYYDPNGDAAGYNVVATIQAGGTVVAGDIEIIAQP
jgi:Ca2+-binding RTX toxin-like protein